MWCAPLASTPLGGCHILLGPFLISRQMGGNDGIILPAYPPTLFCIATVAFYILATGGRNGLPAASRDPPERHWPTAHAQKFRRSARCIMTSHVGCDGNDGGCRGISCPSGTPGRPHRGRHSMPLLPVSLRGYPGASIVVGGGLEGMRRAHVRGSVWFRPNGGFPFLIISYLNETVLYGSLFSDSLGLDRLRRFTCTSKWHAAYSAYLLFTCLIIRIFLFNYLNF